MLIYNQKETREQNKEQRMRTIMITRGSILNKFEEAVGKYYKIDANNYVVVLHGVRKEFVTYEKLSRLCDVLELHVE